jgi:hypothetical protein
MQALVDNGEEVRDKEGMFNKEWAMAQYISGPAGELLDVVVLFLFCLLPTTRYLV